jgi:hypothetical protein
MSMKRQLHLWHRWLGICIGMLVLLWFGSGIVMMYVPYPELTEPERRTWLAPLDPARVHVRADAAWAKTALKGVPIDVRLNTVAGRPAWHFGHDGTWHSVWADTGAPLVVDEWVASSSARSAAPHARSLSFEAIDLDQWTFGSVRVHQPLLRVTADDDVGSVVYVSSRTGELVRDTTRGERAWNWVGAVVHWLYVTPLRKHNDAWRLTVMWASGVALLLAVTGMVVGIQRLRVGRRYAGGRMSPYQGWKGWHHWLGLTGGALIITWLFSGWLSVGPFGFPSGAGVSAQDRLAFAGGAFDRDDLAVDAAALLRAHPGTLELEWRRVGGTLYLSALGRSGRTLLRAQDGAAITMLPQSLMQHAAHAIRPGAAMETTLLTEADDYYYSHHRDAAFPVLRARFLLSDAPVFYIDAVHGRLAGYVDRDSRWNRWLFNGMHQMDFAFLRARPVWDVVVIGLCTVGSALTLTGLVLGWRRLRKG